MSSKKTRKLAAQNIGPIHQFECEVAPGMNLLEAANGSGKSCLLAAVSRAAGSDINVEVRDGAERAQLSLDGTVLLALTRSKAKSAPNVEVSLASVSPLADVIDPGIKERKAAEARRIRGLVSLLNLNTDQDLIAELVANDENAMDSLEDDLSELITLDPVTAAGRIHRALHEKKRGLEKAADEAQGRWRASQAVKPAKLVDVTVADAQKAYDQAVGDHREASGSAAQRKEREKEREEIRATLGERPNLDVEAAAAHEQRLRYEVCLNRVNELKEELAVAQAILGEATANLTAVSTHYDQVRRDAEAWDKSKTILDSEITGSTDADVERVQATVAEWAKVLESARQSAEYRKRLEASEAARNDRDQYNKMAAHYEHLAKNVPNRLGGLLAKAGVPNLTVEDGVLQFVHEDGSLEPFHRLSAGERARVAMPIFIAKNESRLCAFPEAFWHSLEAESRKEIAEILEAHGVVGLTEVATTRGEGLKVEHFETGGGQ